MNALRLPGTRPARNTRSGAERPGEQGPPTAGRALVEDRLEVVLDGVLRDEHQPGDLASIGAACEMLEQFRLAPGQAARPGEQRYPLAGGRGFDADRHVASRRARGAV